LIKSLFFLGYSRFLSIFQFETFGAAWVYDIRGQFQNCGKPAVIAYMGANFFSVLLACGLWFGLDENAVWGGFLGGGLLFFIGIGITAYFLKQKMEEEPGRWSWGSMWWELTFGNIFRLKAKIEPEIGNGTCS
jgi:hypothetical protein